MRPLLLGSDPRTSLREHGERVDGPVPLSRLLRERPEAIRGYYERELASEVDALVALTADTTSHALAQIGMSFRAAALTGTAIELAQEVASASTRPLLVAATMGSTWPASEAREGEELGRSAARLRASGCELVLVSAHAEDRAQRQRAEDLALTAAAEAGLRALLVVDGPETSGEPPEATAERARRAGAVGLLVRARQADEAAGIIEAAGQAELASGALLDAAEGQPDAAWSAEALHLARLGASILGGGAGTRHAHIAALSSLLDTTFPRILQHRSATSG